MLVSFLGTGCSAPPPGRGEVCILLDDGRTRILLDVGAGCYSRLAARGLWLRDIDAVYVSHLHIDHYGGLGEIIVDALIKGYRGSKPLLLAGGLEPEPVLGILPGRSRLLLEPRRLMPMRPYRVGSMILEAVPSVHSVESYAVIVRAGDGSMLLYSGDTRPLYSVVKDFEGGLVVHEATAPTNMCREAMETGHTCVEEALRLAGMTSAATALVHLSTESLRELWLRRPRGVLVPGDDTDFYL